MTQDVTDERKMWVSAAEKMEKSANFTITPIFRAWQNRRDEQNRNIIN